MGLAAKSTALSPETPLSLPSMYHSCALPLLLFPNTSLPVLTAFPSLLGAKVLSVICAFEAYADKLGVLSAVDAAYATCGTKVTTMQRLSIMLSIRFFILSSSNCLPVVFLQHFGEPPCRLAEVFVPWISDIHLPPADVRIRHIQLRQPCKSAVSYTALRN